VQFYTTIQKIGFHLNRIFQNLLYGSPYLRIEHFFFHFFSKNQTLELNKRPGVIHTFLQLIETKFTGNLIELR
jgi:hypothetical protein